MSDTDNQGASQDDLDALLRELGEASDNPPTAKRFADLNAETMDAGGILEDDNHGEDSHEYADTEASKDGIDGIGQDDIDALLNEISNTAEGRGTGSLTHAQSKRLDAVLEQIQAPNEAGSGSKGTLGLTDDQLQDLVSKHSPGPDQPVELETAISQTDIDDLVAQLTAVVGGTGPISAAEVVTGSISRKSKTIQEDPSSHIFPAQTAKMSPNSAKPTASAGKPTATKPAPTKSDTADKGGKPTKPGKSSIKPAVASAANVGALSVVGGAAAIGVLAPSEVRGARWLLIAAVILLAVCATGMGAMVQTLSKLAKHLHTTENNAPIDSDRFALSLTAARNQLSSSDAVDNVTGIAALERLQQDYPTRADELSLEIARHWRTHGDHRKAVAAYAAIAENTLQSGDPRIVLEYANSLAQSGALHEATRQLYALLAREQSFLSREDRLGHPKSAEELARDRAAIQRAYLLLGDLLGRDTGKDNKERKISKNSKDST